MAFHHAALLLTVIFLWFLVINAHGRRDPKFRLSPQQRLTRGIEHFKYNNLNLGTARGYGKRAVNMNHVNGFLLEWIALENKLRNMDMSRNPLRRQETIPE